MTDPVGDIYAAVERQRAALIRMERGAATEMVQAYGRIWRRIDEQVRRLVRRYEKEKITDPDAQLPLARLNELQGQVEAELRRFHDAATKSVLRTEQKAVEAAQRDFRELIGLEADAGVVASWNRLPVSAVESMVGFTSNGSPLRALFDAYGPEASERIRQELIAGLALGQGPRTIARRVRAVMGGDLARALRISRTETARSYREATHLNYQANSHIIDGWRWVAAKRPRTCAACLALDGTWHPLSERQTDHPNGACAQIPAVKDRDSADQPPSWETGSQWLAKQSPEVQQQVLGKAGQKAYAAGAVKLEDFAGTAHSTAWGDTIRAKSLTEIVGKEEAERWKRGGPDSGATPLALEYSPDEALVAKLRGKRMSDAQDIFSEARGERYSRQRIIDEVSDYVNSSHILEQPLCTRSTTDDAMKILDSGRFKTLFETGTSGGLRDDRMRRRAENIGIGAPLDLPPDRRPIYGYFDASGIGRQDRVGGYGSLKWVLKDEVRDTRTTATWGDSLGQFYESRAVGAPVGRFAVEPAAWNNTLLDDCAERASPSDWRIAYVEAQIQGQVALSDIDHVEWTVDTWYGWMPDDPASGPNAVVSQALQGLVSGKDLYRRLIDAGIRVVLSR